MLSSKKNDNDRERKDRICKELASIIKEVIVNYQCKFVSVFKSGDITKNYRTDSVATFTALPLLLS